MDDNENLAMSIYDIVIKDLCKKDSKFDVFDNALDAKVEDGTFWLEYPLNSEAYKLMNRDGNTYGECKRRIQDEIRDYYSKNTRLKIRYLNVGSNQANKVKSEPVTTDSKTTEPAKEQDDFVGKKFGHLTVVELDHAGPAGGRYYKVKCDCGNETIIKGSALSYGQKTCGFSCPYCSTREIDETGNVYGKLKVIRKTKKPEEAKENATYWLCECECGNTRIVAGKTLRKGSVTTCKKCAHKKQLEFYSGRAESRTAIGTKIDNWKDKHHFTYADFGRMAGCSPGYVSGLCRYPTVKTTKKSLSKIAKVMNCTLEELIEGTEHEYILDGKKPKPVPKQLQTKPKQNNPEPPKDSFTESTCSGCLEVFRTSLKIDGEWTPYTAEYCPHCGSRILTEQQQEEIKRLVEFGMTEQNATEYVKQAI